MAWGNITDLYRMSASPIPPYTPETKGLKGASESVSAETATIKAPEADAAAVVAVKEDEKQAVSKPNAGLQDVTLSLSSSSGYGYIGSDASVLSLDMEKAISEMQKDRLLQQYQTFVGRSGNLLASNTDGMVIAKA